MQEHTTFAATLDAAAQVSRNLETLLRDLPPDVCAAVVLAVHELLVNIVRHAYAGAPGQIDLAVERSPVAVRFIIVDDAASDFVLPNRVAVPNLLDLPEHGMGLFIIRQTFDHVIHERLCPGSRWELVRILGD